MTVTLLVGVDDQSHDIRGLEDPLLEEERLTNIISDGIRPRLVPEINIIAWKEKQIISVEVFPGAQRPYWLTSAGPEGGVFIRIGSSSRQADEGTIKEIQNSVTNASADERPLPEISSEAINFRVAAEYFSEYRKLEHSDMQTLRIVVPYQNRLVPSLGGLLLFGNDDERENRCPDAWVQCARFSGNDKSIIVDRVDCRGNLIELAFQANEFIRKHSQMSAEISGLQRKDVVNLPEIATREAIINAIVHADYTQAGSPIRVAFYDTHIEIENPGILPLGITIDDIRNGVSKLRNRVIGRVFRELKFIEQWGSGIQRMTAACVERGLPNPEFEEIGLHFRVKIRFDNRTEVPLDAYERLILDLIRDAEDGLSTNEIAEATEKSSRTVRSRMRLLTNKGLVQAIGRSPNDPGRRYYITKR